MPTDADRGFGPIDGDALGRVRDVFLEHEPLVEAAALDSRQWPTMLTVTLTDGFEAPGRFDVRWSRRGYYGFHYREPEAALEYRFDRHPNPHSPERHVHPPPDAARGTAEPSAIRVGTPELVALAVIHSWRHALDCGDVDRVNALDDPP